MAAYPRAELEEMVERWLQANRDAEKAGNWPKYLGAMYTDDAEYRWNIGPNEEFVARSRKEIEEWALGVQMEGFEEWRYPYHRILSDWSLASSFASPSGGRHALSSRRHWRVLVSLWR
jgi:hypothetical protein